MEEYQHTVLCVDDEMNILNSLKRLLRKENYRLLVASSIEEGFKILKENTVNVVISDQRMPVMTGSEFLAEVKEQYPDIIRVMLTGYTDVNSIMESINKGHIYKFLLKPWNDQNLILEIRQTLEHFELIRSNKYLNQKILDQNQELKELNENLEEVLKKRTDELIVQRRGLEIAHAILHNLPMPILGVSAEGMVVLLNMRAESLLINDKVVYVGGNIEDYFPAPVQKSVETVMKTGVSEVVQNFQLGEIAYEISITPLLGELRDRGVILTLKEKYYS
ncbi:MAG: response regulator [Thermodesulfobacteriota bacterium]|nr:response regulator [Thermodesulfobacteriota bacterium]